MDKELFSKQMSFRMPIDYESELLEIARKRRCKLATIIREAIGFYLEKIKDAA